MCVKLLNNILRWCSTATMSIWFSSRAWGSWFSCLLSISSVSLTSKWNFSLKSCYWNGSYGSFSNDLTSQQCSDKILTWRDHLFPLETLSTNVLFGKLDSTAWWRQEKGTRNSVLTRRVTLYVVGGKLRRRSSRTKEWPRTTKDQKAFMGEEQTEEYWRETGWGVFGRTNWEATVHKKLIVTSRSIEEKENNKINWLKLWKKYSSCICLILQSGA